MSSNPVETVTDFFAQWGKSWDALVGSFHQYVGDDLTWIQAGIPDVHSLDEAVGLLGGLHDGVGIESIEVIITKLAADGNVVFTERVDNFRKADGSILLTADVAGVLEVDDNGKIIWWREYFDPREILALMGA